MSKAFRDHFERQFRLSKKKGDDSLMSALAIQKLKQPVQVYSDLIKAFKSAAPIAEKQFRHKGRDKFKDLWWFGVMSPTTIEKEFAFAPEWLKDGVASLNEFRILANTAEEALLLGDLETALNVVRSHRSNYGWTVWGVELEYALTSLSGDDAETRELANRLTETSSPRIASLLATVFRDRTDNAMSLGAFLEKCNQSIPRLGVSPSLKAYLSYRTSDTVSDIRQDAPSILACELNNSIFDYYEVLIDLSATIATDEVHESLRPLVVETARRLIDIGVSDHRLSRLLFLCGAIVDMRMERHESKNIEIVLDAFFGQDTLVKDPGFLANLMSSITKIRNEGAAAATEIGELCRLGLNLRGLNLGLALIGFCAGGVTNFSGGGICGGWGQFATSKVRLEDFLSLESSHAKSLLSAASLKDYDAKVSEEAKNLMLFLEQKYSSDVEELSGHRLVWLIKEKIKAHADTRHLLHQLTSLGIPWTRQALKLRILNAAVSENLLDAINLAAEVFLNEPANMAEVPLNYIFEKRKWADFKALDPVAVGIVAHNAYELNGDANARYICRMACRNFKQSGARTKILENWEIASPEYQRMLIAFFEFIWLDDNLTMAGFLSTQEVRNERIEVLQILLQINSEKEIEYAEEIKQLTFAETLWKGLQHINETRIFVNEAAITRWAEKELLSDFNRWKTTHGSDKTLIPELDEILRSYLVGSDSTALLAAFQKNDLTQSDALLVNIAERLLNRFLMDPTDGLNCYLSSRIRHGTLKGALLGPLEEAGILGASDADIASDYRVVNAGISPELIPYVVSSIQTFGQRVTAITDRLVNETIQIRDVNTPKGYIYVVMNPEYAGKALAAIALESNFSGFLSTCFELFWNLLRESLSALADHFRHEVKKELNTEFDQLISSLRKVGDASTGLVTSIRTVATLTQSQCDFVANWFESDPSLEKQVFSLGEAIEIAKTATKYIYRSFPVGTVKNILPDETIPLTPLGLSAITDGLFVMLVNAWKHSGLGGNISWLSVTATLDTDSYTLVLTSTNPLSKTQLENLKNGGLQEIKDKYISNPSFDMAPREGGSGFAKLAGLVRMTDREKYPEPLTIDLDKEEEDAVTVTACIPVYLRGEAFDAYFG